MTRNEIKFDESQVSYSPREVADYLKVSDSTVKKWINAGSLRAVNVSENRESKHPKWRILEKDLDVFLVSRLHPSTWQTRRSPYRHKLKGPKYF